MGPPPPEQAPRPRPEVNTGRPRVDGLAQLSGRGGGYRPAQSGGAGPGRREGGQSFGILRGPGGVLRLEESWSCLSRWGKLRRGGSPSRLATPRGRPRSGRSRRLTVGTLSHFLLVAYPSPVASAGESCPRPSAGSGVGVLRKEAPRPSPHTYTPSLQWKRVQLGFRELPDPCVRFTWETWLLSIASMPACETKLYYAVTSHKVREWGRAGACLQASAFTRCPEFQTLLPPPIFQPVSWPDNKRPRSSKLSLISCLSSDLLGVLNH